MPKMSSRQRMLAALNCKEPDHVPCSFMLYNALRDQSRDFADFIERQVALGLDAYVQIPPRPPVWKSDHFNLPGLPVIYDPRVTTKEWIERLGNEKWPILVKEYRTPAGTLRTEVRQTDDWPYGDHIPFLDDYLTPRSRKFLLTGPEDLPAFRYLLVPPTQAEVAAFHTGSASAIELARRHDLLLAAGWGVGADLVGWVYGLENMMYAVYDQPEFVRELLGIIATWNRQRMEVMLDAGIDFFIKRAWYENLDFFTPKTWQEFIYPILKADVDLAHSKGAKFGYIITANCMALLDMFVEAGIDAIIGVDPDAWDMAEAKRKVGGKICLWGGVSGHLTVEQGTAEEVRQAVREAMRLLAPGGGFILSPVDNVREHTETARTNTAVLLDEWRRLTGQ